MSTRTHEFSRRGGRVQGGQGGVECHLAYVAAVWLSSLPGTASERMIYNHVEWHSDDILLAVMACWWGSRRHGSSVSATGRWSTPGPRGCMVGSYELSCSYQWDTIHCQKLFTVRTVMHVYSSLLRRKMCTNVHKMGANTFLSKICDLRISIRREKVAFCTCTRQTTKWSVCASRWTAFKKKKNRSWWRSPILGIM